MMSTYIYIVANADWTDIAKVGTTKNPAQRFPKYITYWKHKFECLHLWRLTNIPDKFKQYTEHDRVLLKILEVIESKDLRHVYFGGSTELVSGDYSRIPDVMKSFGYTMEAEDYDNIVQDCIDTYLNKNKAIDTSITSSVMETIPKPCLYKPSPHQEDTLNLMVEYYKNNTIGKVIWACGLGKSLLAVFSMKIMECKSVVIGVPSIQLQEQFITELVKLFPNEKNILRIGGGSKTISLSDVNKFLSSKRDYKFIVTTYSSCHLIANLENPFTFDYKIGDEAHHLCCMGNSSERPYTAFHKIASQKSLFMTATEKVIESEDKTDIVKYSMNDESIFGKYIDTKSISWAIENGKITDYSVLVMKNTVQVVDNIIERLNIDVYNKDLFVAAYMTLKAMTMYHGITHTLIYANNINNANLINLFINELMNSDIIDIDKSEIYNNVLHSRSSENICNEIANFKASDYGIIVCVYIFGEGFDLPKLNAVTFADNMESDIRIVQSTLRANRLDKNNANKHSYVIIPYIDKNNWDEDNKSFDKCRRLISKLRNVDDTIEQKIKAVIVLPKKVGDTTKDNVLTINDVVIDDANYLDQLIMRLRHSKSLCSKLTQEQDEYNYVRCLNKELAMYTKDDYFKSKMYHKYWFDDPEKHFKQQCVWRDWYHFLGVDTASFLQSKHEWLQFCMQHNVQSLEEYISLSKKYTQIPLHPSEFYKDFTNILSELGILRVRRF